jgi:hypothetical protein
VSYYTFTELSRPCPECHAKPGQKCRNYRGKGKPMCKGRKDDATRRTEAVVRSVSKAERLNQAEREAMPLLAAAGLAADHTAASLHRHWRLTVARHAEDTRGYVGGVYVFHLLRLHRLERVARAYTGEAFDKLRDYCRRTYPCITYYGEFWRGVLTGKRVEFAWEAVPDRKPGELAVRCTDSYQRVHMTQDDFYRLFPYKPDEPPDQDDGGVAALLARVFDTPR